jgi:NADPH:quinone reductase-like Zn-dependent oxidoreductase
MIALIGGPSFGGYSNAIVVDKNFVLRIPEGMELAGAAPLLCAGITTYSPLRQREGTMVQVGAPEFRWFTDRRHCGDAGDAGFLRRA